MKRFVGIVAAVLFGSASAFAELDFGADFIFQGAKSDTLSFEKIQNRSVSDVSADQNQYLGLGVAGNVTLFLNPYEPFQAGVYFDFQYLRAQNIELKFKDSHKISGDWTGNEFRGTLGIDGRMNVSRPLFLDLTAGLYLNYKKFETEKNTDLTEFSLGAEIGISGGLRLIKIGNFSSGFILGTKLVVDFYGSGKIEQSSYGKSDFREKNAIGVEAFAGFRFMI